MSSVSDVAGKIYDTLGDSSEDQCRLAIEPFINSIIDFDKSQCYIAASLRNKTKRKGLSLGDRACLAVALQLDLPVYTADKMWAALDIPNLKLNLIR